MSEFATQFTFRTEAELEGANRAIASMEAELGTLKALGAEVTTVTEKEKALAEAKRRTADASAPLIKSLNDEAAAQASLAAAGNGIGAENLGGIGGAFRGAGNLRDAMRAEEIAGMATRLAAVVAAAGAVAGVLIKLSQAADAQRVVFENLDGALQRQGLDADALRTKYAALADELQSSTNVQAEEWIQVLTRLTEFGSRPESIGLDLEAVKNLAGVMGGDLHSAALLWGKALEGNFEGLARYGISVKDAGTYSEKLAQAMEQAATKGAGKLEAATKGLTGGLRSFRNSLGDAETAQGRFWQPLTDRLGLSIKELGDNFVSLTKIFSAENPVEQTITHAALGHERLARATQGTGEAQKAAAMQIESLTRSLDAQTGAMERTLAAANLLAAAQKEVDLARVDAAEKAGAITGEQAILARADIEQRSGRAGEARREQVDAQQIIKLRNFASDLNIAVAAQERLVDSLRGGPDKESLRKAEEELARRRRERDERGPAAITSAEQLQEDIRTRGTALGLREQAGNFRAGAGIIGARQAEARQAAAEDNAAAADQRRRENAVRQGIQTGGPINFTPAVRAAATGAQEIERGIQSMAAALGARDQRILEQIQALTRQVQDLQQSRRVP